jgi:photosystem II stability/assembly factor-like uncharacterized protein
MIIAKTYTVGDKGTVRKLVDLTLPWVDVSVSLVIPNASSHPLFDVETDPLDGNKVFAVGRGASSGSVFGIYVSTDGGSTWYIPGGNYQTNTVQGILNWYEVWVLDSNNIMVSGQNGYVAISNDGGLTFNLTTQLPALIPFPLGSPVIPNVYSVHFVTPTVGVVGLEGHVAMTINGGSTWAILNSGNIIIDGPSQLINGTGIRITADQQNIVVLGQSAIFQSLDGGVTWSNVYDFILRNGVHLTWTTEQALWAFGNFEERVNSIDGGTTWNIISAGSFIGPDQKAGHFYSGLNGFFSQNTELFSTNDGSLVGVPSDNSPNGINAVWTNFREVCYLLTSCDDTAAPILVGNDLSAYVGQAIRVCSTDIPDPDFEGCKCFSIAISQSCIGGITLPTIDIFTDCNTCTPVCYLLTDCTDPQNTILASDDLSQYVGLIVKLSECPDTCWQVTESVSCTGSVCVSEVIESFATCVECLPPVPVPDPLELHARRVKPGYYTPGCSPEYTERVNCNFAESMYSQMLVSRYGLTICCEDEWTDWGIKKVLLDFKALYDPSLCKCYLQDCCPPTCVEAVLQVFTPVYCLAPSTVSAILDY